VVKVQRPDADIARLPPPRRPALIAAMADKAHKGPRDKEGQDEGDQTAQQRQAAAVDDVMLQPMAHPQKVTPPARLSRKPRCVGKTKHGND
jgi:hypothetical protein